MLVLESELGLCHILENISELEEIPEPNGERIFLDLETTGFRPYQGDRLHGIALCLEEGDAYYIPIRHNLCDYNLPADKVLSWLDKYINSFSKWINHNINFDHHFLWVDGIEFKRPGKTICTFMLSMLVDAEYPNHKLKSLCRLFGLEMEDEILLDQWFKNNKIKKDDRNYADLPYDLCGKYACMDVLGNRFLYNKLVRKLPRTMLSLVKQEIDFTRTLFEIERRGIKIDRRKNIVDGFRATSRLEEIVAELEATFAVEFKDHTSYRRNIIINKLGLPVVHFSKKKVNRYTGVVSGGGPSFDKDALVKYKALPEVLLDPLKERTIDLLAEYGALASHQKLFMNRLEEYGDHKDRIHPSYMQNVRTGRMSNSSPSIMVQNKKSKELFIVDDNYNDLNFAVKEGWALSDWDADQIEFRLIVHEIQNPMAIQAYAKDPNTDFHNWTANNANILRALAKTINFSLAYGAGEKKILFEISRNKDVVSALIKEMQEEGLDPLEEHVRIFQQRIAQKAKDIFNSYHKALPEIKEATKEAESFCKKHGYIENFFGRRRRIPWKFAYSAFNTKVQGGAMDYIKGRMIALQKFEKENVYIVLNVHDSLLFTGPRDVMRDPQMHKEIKKELEIIPEGITVPLTWSGGYSETTWAAAASDDPKYDEDGNFVSGPLKYMYDEPKPE